MKSLLSVSLILLSCCFSSTNSFNLFSERNEDCTESSPFLIKNYSPNTKKPYLTLDVKKNSLSGGKLSKAGKPKKNQIWTWVNCGDGDFLSSQAEGKLLSINGKALSVVEAVFNSPSAWIYDSELGTLHDVQSKKYVRLIKKKARVALAKKLRLMKKGPGKESPGDGSAGLLSFWILTLGLVLAQDLALNLALGQDSALNLALDQDLALNSALDQDLALNLALDQDLVLDLALGQDLVLASSPLVQALGLSQDVLTVKQ